MSTQDHRRIEAPDYRPSIDSETEDGLMTIFEAYSRNTTAWITIEESALVEVEE
jgi:hypothetical protein